MNLDWQMVAALVLVAGAVAYLARLAWRSLHTSGGCGSCGGGCADKSLGEAKPLVSIDLPEPSSPASKPE